MAKRGRDYVYHKKIGRFVFPGHTIEKGFWHFQGACSCLSVVRRLYGYSSGNTDVGEDIFCLQARAPRYRNYASVFEQREAEQNIKGNTFR